MIARIDEPEPESLNIEVSWDGDSLDDPLVDDATVSRVLRHVLNDHGRNTLIEIQLDGRTTGQLLVAIVGDDVIHELNREHLQHDYTTDVLSFNYGPDVDPDETAIDTVDGEIIVNADYATRSGPENKLEPATELLLYCIHGTLHILGYDDQDDDARAVMEAKQLAYLAALG